MSSETWRRFYLRKRAADARMRPGEGVPDSRVERIRLLTADFVSGEPERLELACMIGFACGVANAQPLAREELLLMDESFRGVHPVVLHLQELWNRRDLTPFLRMLCALALGSLEKREQLATNRCIFSSVEPEGGRYNSEPVVSELLGWTSAPSTTEELGRWPYEPHTPDTVLAAVCGLGRYGMFVSHQHRESIKERVRAMKATNPQGELLELLTDVTAYLK